MQFELPFSTSDARPAPGEWLRVGSRHLRLQVIPNRRARRYVLRLTREGAARVTVPRGGSAMEARRFAERNAPWLERQLLRQASRNAQPRCWQPGTSILYRGEAVRLEHSAGGDPACIRLGEEAIPVQDVSADLRPEVESFLRRLAGKDLPARTLELSSLHGIPIRSICVRNQRSRWGSCSRRGTISLNWRLIQAPPFVRDYIILHELAHVRHMNHSRRFWREVARLCPGYLEAEKWLKQHSELLL